MIDSDEDILTKAIYIDESIEFDPNSLPTNGSEYVKLVRHEARQCQQVVVASIDSSRFKTPTLIVDPSSNIKPAPKALCPTLEWQRVEIALFSDIRHSISAIKYDPVKKNKYLHNKIELPAIDDTVAWCQFCFGKLVNKITHPEVVSINGNEDGQGHLPLLSIMLQMDQPTIETVLEYHIKWLEVFGMSRQQGVWLYALLAVLEKPLTPDVCSLLRDLARLCASLRVNLESQDDERLSPLNLMICLVARYYDQTDLADN